MPFVYILRCADGSYYVGKTDDVGALVSQAFLDGQVGLEERRIVLKLARVTATMMAVESK